MPHHHLLSWLISRVSDLARPLNHLFKSAAQVVQVGLFQDKRLLRRANRKNDSRHRDPEEPIGRRRTTEKESECGDSLRRGGFIITCPARSGSTMLVHLLRSHPEICSHDEVFSPEKVKGMTGTYLERIEEDPSFIDLLSSDRYCDPIKFLYTRALDPQEKTIVGFKLKHDELVLPGYKILRDEIAANRKLRIIHLRRNNLLRRYVSHYIASHVTRVTLAVSNQPIPDLPCIRLDPVACEKDFETVLAREAEFTALFDSHPHFSISYEDMVRGDLNKLDHLLGFLNVSPRPLTTPTQKLGRDDLRTVIENFDELREYFSNSRFAQFFEAV
jgi:LPS sulfotransferase NodH